MMTDVAAVFIHRDANSGGRGIPGV